MSSRSGKVQGKAISGVLDVHIHHACNLPGIGDLGDQDVYGRLFFGKQDPFCDAFLQTKTIRKGGSRPVFDQSLQIGVPRGEKVLFCEIYSSQPRGKDCLIGCAQVPLDEVLSHGGQRKRRKPTEYSLFKSLPLHDSPAAARTLSLSVGQGPHTQIHGASLSSSSVGAVSLSLSYHGKACSQQVQQQQQQQELKVKGTQESEERARINVLAPIGQSEVPFAEPCGYASEPAEKRQKLLEGAAAEITKLDGQGGAPLPLFPLSGGGSAVQAVPWPGVFGGVVEQGRLPIPTLAPPLLDSSTSSQPPAPAHPTAGAADFSPQQQQQLQQRNLLPVGFTHMQHQEHLHHQQQHPFPFMISQQQALWQHQQQLQLTQQLHHQPSPFPSASPRLLPPASPAAATHSSQPHPSLPFPPPPPHALPPHYWLYCRPGAVIPPPAGPPGMGAGSAPAPTLPAFVAPAVAGAEYAAPDSSNTPIGGRGWGFVPGVLTTQKGDQMGAAPGGEPPTVCVGDPCGIRSDLPVVGSTAGRSSDLGNCGRWSSGGVGSVLQNTLMLNECPQQGNGPGGTKALFTDVANTAGPPQPESASSLSRASTPLIRTSAFRPYSPLQRQAELQTPSSKHHSTEQQEEQVQQEQQWGKLQEVEDCVGRGDLDKTMEDGMHRHVADMHLELGLGSRPRGKITSPNSVLEVGDEMEGGEEQAESSKSAHDFAGNSQDVKARRLGSLPEKQQQQQMQLPGIGSLPEVSHVPPPLDLRLNLALCSSRTDSEDIHPQAVQQEGDATVGQGGSSSGAPIASSEIQGSTGEPNGAVRDSFPAITLQQQQQGQQKQQEQKQQEQQPEGLEAQDQPESCDSLLKELIQHCRSPVAPGGLDDEVKGQGAMAEDEALLQQRKQMWNELWRRLEGQRRREGAVAAAAVQVGQPVTAQGSTSIYYGCSAFF